MIDQALGLVGLAALCAAVLLALAGVLTKPRGERRFCPGPGRWWHTAALPWRWFVRRFCAYDLTGLPSDRESNSRCPECGRVSKPAERFRGTRRFRVFTTAGVVLVIAAGFSTAPRIHSGGWARGMPTLALIQAERVLNDGRGAFVRQELNRRISAGELVEVDSRLLCEMLIRDLRSDDRHWNGERARDRLVQLWPTSQPALERALASPDRQTRLLAAGILRQMPVTAASEPLMRACLEDLSDDGDREVGAYLREYNATDAVSFLVRCGSASAQYVREGMGSSDPQQRLLAAAIAGRCGLVELIDLAAPILIAHARDNNISGDAIIAASALLDFGKAVVPYLEPFRHDPDVQLRQTARAILARLGRPTDPANPALDREPGITSRGSHPLDIRLEHISVQFDWPR